MHRLFVAIRPPSDVRARLIGLQGGVPNARWQEEAQLHLTLRFIGEVDRHGAEDVTAALAMVRQAPFEVALSGVGSFSRRGQGALWAGIAPPDGLRHLHKKVDQACVRAGIAPNGRAYHPHITLARLGRNAGPAEPFIARWAGLSGPAFTVEAICLYESRLGAQGASYTIMRRYPLA